jgi:hypothetical protein
MDGAMSRWNSGARGDSVVDGPSGDSSPGMSASGNDQSSIVINGGVMQFGGDDYIRKDQLPAIISQASKAGEARTLGRLKNSQSVRRKVGI